MLKCDKCEHYKSNEKVLYCDKYKKAAANGYGMKAIADRYCLNKKA